METLKQHCCSCGDEIQPGRLHQLQTPQAAMTDVSRRKEPASGRSGRDPSGVLTGCCVLQQKRHHWPVCKLAGSQAGYCQEVWPHPDAQDSETGTLPFLKQWLSSLVEFISTGLLAHAKSPLGNLLIQRLLGLGWS